MGFLIHGIFNTWICGEGDFHENPTMFIKMLGIFMKVQFFDTIMYPPLWAASRACRPCIKNRTVYISHAPSISGRRL